jgi:EpsI family protein
MAIDRRAAIGGIALMLATAAGAGATPTRRLAEELPPLDLEADIPKHFGNWSLDRLVVPVLPAPDVQEKLDALYNKLLSRTYVDDEGRRIMFVIAYGADQADRMTLAHLPESCYSSQGFEISPTEVAHVPIANGAMQVRRLRTRKAARVEPVTYWTTIGNGAYVDEFGRRMARARYSLQGIIPDGMLVRASTIDDDNAAGFALQGSFLAQLFGALPAGMRTRIFGVTA